MMLCAGLVFIMHLGFATLESGLTRAKNTTNILFKNTFIVSIGILTYALCGFNLMYRGEFNRGTALHPDRPWRGLRTRQQRGRLRRRGIHLLDCFSLPGEFAATAATSVSGAVAERIRLPSFMLCSVFFVGLVYPILGSWKWGGGGLDEAGFYDFAGSTRGHCVGGWGALVGA